ncbi:MAG: methyltransferase domain-containing protein [Anaerolineaceae bacterium]|nr:MAG: methyltransferase domain-containing protein [Anaerolineaceae bacterium]
MSEFDQSQKEFWSENTNLRAYDHPVVETFARQRVDFIRGLLDTPIQACLEVGCDISRPMLRRNPLRQFVAEADIYHLPYADKSFDLVYCWEVIHHVKDMQSAIREMIRLSRRFILMYEPNAFNPLQVGFGLIAPSELGTLRFHPWYMRNHFRRAGLTDIRTFSVGTFTPNRTPLWLYKILAALPYRVPLFGISNFALAQVPS